MFGQGIPRSFLWFVSLCAVLSIGIISCGGDDGDNWIGTWAIETVDGQSYEQVLEEGEEVKASIVTNNWTFNDDGTMEAELAVQIESTEEGFEFSGEVSIKIMGTYSLSGPNYTLTVTSEETGAFGDGSSTDVDTGTWSRTGNTLTLTSDEDGTIIVFKKK